MKLNLESLKNNTIWENAGFQLPKFDIENVRLTTKKSPTWIHFGAGNIFRALMANAQQNLLNNGISNEGIVVVGGESIETIYRAHDNLTVLVTLKSDGSIEKTVIGSIAESLVLDTKKETDWNRLKEIFANPSLQMVSFTITEKGYSLKDSKGQYLSDVELDFKNGPHCPTSYMGKIVSLLHERYLHGKEPIAMVSMDNMSENGVKLYNSVDAFIKEWISRGFVAEGFKVYVDSRNLVSFPLTMIDKITPSPNPNVRNMLKEVGFEDVEDVITSRGSFASPFVNAEELEYLVIEDVFPNGRPMLEESGIIFTDGKTVGRVEKMKVSTCLNPLHTSLAIFGCLLGYNLISEEMKDPELKTLVEKIGYEEGFPVVVDPGIIDPKRFIDEVIQIRFPNPFVPDTPQRIATDTSQKLAVRFGETIKSYVARDDLNVMDLTFIPLVIAGWCRYLLGVDDDGKTMEISPDPLLNELIPYLSGINIGDKRSFYRELRPILSNETIFGLNLYEIGLGEKIEDYFAEFVSGTGAVRETLKKYLY